MYVIVKLAGQGQPGHPYRFRSGHGLPGVKYGQGKQIRFLISVAPFFVIKGNDCEL
jgi:hypothetical protein